MNMKKFITELLIYNIILLAFFHILINPSRHGQSIPISILLSKIVTISFIIFIPVGEKSLCLYLEARIGLYIKISKILTGFK